MPSAGSTVSTISTLPSGPSAKAIAVPGGYRVTGRKPFSTGCRHASWIAAHAQIIEDGNVRLRDGKPEARYCLVPKAKAQLLDTWHTRGMRGTGTHNFVVEDEIRNEPAMLFVEHDVLLGRKVVLVLELHWASSSAAGRSCNHAFCQAG